MKLSSLIVVVFILILGGIGVFLIFGGEDSSNSDSNILQTESIPQLESSSDAESQQISTARYIEYTDGILEEATEDKRVLFFHASWCSICKSYEKQIEENGIPEGIQVVKIDYDSMTELKKQYGVNVQSTFILVDADGNEVRKWPYSQGLQDAADLFEQVQAESV